MKQPPEIPSGGGLDVPRRRWPGWLGFGVLGLAIGAVVAWAAAVVLVPPQELLVERPYTFVELVDGEVGSSLSLNTVAAWDQVPLALNRAAGTVTSVSVKAGAEVEAGDVLYAVDLRPVVIAVGKVPAFRAMAPGMAGSDIKQLQRLLVEVGVYHAKPDGKFGQATATAVRAWHRRLGLPADASVPLGELVFVPSLPVRVMLDSKLVARGTLLTGGEAAIRRLAAEPSFTVPVSESQAALIPDGTRVEVRLDDLTWPAVAASQARDTEHPETILVRLTAPDGGVVCATECDLLPAKGEETLLPSRIITQETVSGVVVPSAALWSDPRGQVSVIDDAGVEHPVTVLASARGMSVIDGAPAGLRVRIPGTPGATQEGR